jgi:L-alanine-DL-glutamate epimerase-like enolase superfamily enzyme
VKLDYARRMLRLASPLETAYGTVRERELLVVALSDEQGICGYGEAAPLEPYDGVGISRVEQALERYRAVLAERPASDGRTNGASGLLDACRSADELPAALAAIDLALWDRAGRRARRPVAALLSERPATQVPVNATISGLDRAGVAQQAARAAREGFRCVKLKVGAGDDAGRVAAARAAAGPAVALRLDANGAWSVEQAVRTIAALSPAGLELVEEPAHGVRAVREVRERVAVRVAIDETAGEPGALGAGAADAVCLKISRCGGISGLLAAAALVRASGAEVYLASTLDGPLGIAAAVHAAAALASRGPLAPCGLATLALFEGLENPLPAEAGSIRVPQAAGLGVGPL